jgi:hypothetical protein
MSSIGCGDSACVSSTNKYFCSRSCRNEAFRNGIIDYDDINKDVSCLLLTNDAHDRSFSIKQFTTLVVKSSENKSIGCDDDMCVSKKNISFCSRSCKNRAISLKLIKDIDIDYDVSNLKLTTQAHVKLFF